MREHAVATKKVTRRARNRGALLLVSVLFHSWLACLPWQKDARPSAVTISAMPIAVVSASQLPSSPINEPSPLSAVPTAIPSPPAAVSSPSALSADLPPAASAVEPAVASIEEPAIEEMPTPDSMPEKDAVTEPINVSDNSDDKRNNGNERDLANEEDEAEGDEAEGNENEAEGNGDEAEGNGDEAEDNDAAISAAWGSFIGYLQTQSGGFEGMSLLDIFSLFGEPNQVSDFFDENDQPKLDVSSYHLFPEQTPEAVVDAIIKPKLSNQSDFKLQPLKNLSPGLTYQILQGEAFRYLTIVRLNEDSGSVLIMSNSLPTL